MCEQKAEGLLLAESKLASDRRQWQRVPVGIPIFVRGLDQQGKHFLEFTCALNISAGGALVATRQNLLRRSRVSLEIPSPPLPRVGLFRQSRRNLQARLVRLAHSNGCHVWGLQFTRPLVIKT